MRARRDIPMGLDAQTALYRTVLADRRVLVVLDDVADASYVRRLLPASRGSLTLVTSRQKLSGLVTLDGAFRVACDVLGEDEALELVRAVIGPEAVADYPDSASKLVELCDRLPLALRVAGSWISDRRPDGIRSYVRDLEERGRLVRLHVEGEERVAVRAALDMSYNTLPDEAKHAFRMLGLMPGTGRSVCAAAAAAGLDASHLADLLRLAQRVHLLRDIESGRLAWHDLVHEYARDHLLVEENVAERASAIERILDHYLYSIVNLARTCGLYVCQRLRKRSMDQFPGSSARRRKRTRGLTASGTTSRPRLSIRRNMARLVTRGSWWTLCRICSIIGAHWPTGCGWPHSLGKRPRGPVIDWSGSHVLRHRACTLARRRFEGCPT